MNKIQKRTKINDSEPQQKKKKRGITYEVGK